MTSEPTESEEPIVIIGSRLQALISFTTAIVVGIALAPTSALLATLAGVGFGLAGLIILARRVELHLDHIEIRRLLRMRRLQADELALSMGHRYLVLGERGAVGVTKRRFRIEVPVEIRPDVRAWVERNSGSDEEKRTS